jgi:hypothetical protein
MKIRKNLIHVLEKGILPRKAGNILRDLKDKNCQPLPQLSPLVLQAGCFQARRFYRHQIVGNE